MVLILLLVYCSAHTALQIYGLIDQMSIKLPSVVHGLKLVYLEINDIRVTRAPGKSNFFVPFCSSSYGVCMSEKAWMSPCSCHLHVTLWDATSSYFAALTDSSGRPPPPGRQTDNTTNSNTGFQ